MRRCSLLAMLLILAAPAFGQDVNMPSLLAGKDLPLRLQLKDLNGDWQRVRVGQTDQAGGLGSFLKQIMQIGMMTGMSQGGTGAAKPDSDALMGMLFLSSLLGGQNDSADVFYTRGQTRVIGGETFLVAYHLPSQAPDLAKLIAQSQQSGGPPPDLSQMLAPKRTAEDALTLALLNLKTIGSLSDIRPFDLSQELAESDNSLASTLMPVFQQSREKAIAISSLSNLKQLGLGTLMYTQDYDENFPPMTDYAAFKKAVMPYVKNEMLFTNPITGEAYHLNSRLSKKNLSSVANPAEMAMIYEASPAPDGTRGVCYVDGHSKRVTEAQWQDVKKASGMP